MIDLGTVKPGSTIRIPFSSFDKDDGSSITMTNYTAADILIYKDGSTTERASTAGFTATTDFDGKTGKHLAVIDLADNTTAGFYNAGSEYLVAIDAVTVDAVTTGGWIARFRIGYPDAHLDTTIASLSSQTSFTLTAGPAEDDALNGCVVLIHDIASAVQLGYAVVSDYTGSTKTVTLTAGVTFTAAAGDNISIFPPGNTRWFNALLTVALPIAPATAGRPLLVDANGVADARLADAVSHGGTLGSSTATLALSRLNVTSQTSNTNAITATGNGTGHGAALTSGSGATGNGLTLLAASTNGHGLKSTGTGTGDGAELTAGASGADLDADEVAAIKAVTDLLPDAGALTSLATQASVNTIDDFLDTEIAAIKAKTDQLTFTVANQVDANALTVDEDEILDDALTDSVPADGSLPTVRQALYMLTQFMFERSVSGTTVTVNKVDGTTALMTFTLNDGTSPTAITRAT